MGGSKNKVMSKVKVVSVDSSPSDVVYVHLSYAIQHLEGQILTFIDASISDPVQRKALKDLLSPMIWKWAIDFNARENYEIEQKAVGSNFRDFFPLTQTN